MSGTFGLMEFWRDDSGANEKRQRRAGSPGARCRDCGCRLREGNGSGRCEPCRWARHLARVEREGRADAARDERVAPRYHPPTPAQRRRLVEGIARRNAERLAAPLTDGERAALRLLDARGAQPFRVLAPLLGTCRTRLVALGLARMTGGERRYSITEAGRAAVAEAAA